MPRVSKYAQRKGQLVGGAATPQDMVKTLKQAELKAEKQEEKEVKADRQKLFRAWTRF